jgi:hypothetical protein
LLATGCVKTKAASVPDGPPLAVPMAPPRVLAPVEEEPLADNPPPPETAPAPPRTNARPANPQPPRRPPTTTTTPVEEPKPEPPAQTPPAVTEAPAPRPAPTQADAAAERKVRDVMRKASADIGRVDYQRLSTEGKQQYDFSKRFNEQAEQALKERNYAFATTLAEKAADLAAALLGAR